jgi:hypothetical protein
MPEEKMLQPGGIALAATLPSRMSAHQNQTFGAARQPLDFPC